MPKGPPPMVISTKNWWNTYASGAYFNSRDRDRDRDRDKNEFQFTRQSKSVPKSISKICPNIFSLSLSLPPISIHHLELETETNFETNSETNSY